MALTASFRVTVLAALSMFGGLSLASAQCPSTSPNFAPDFSAAGAASCFQLNPASGSYLPSITNAATLSSSTVLRLTPSMGGLAASAWYTNPQPVASGFTTTFSFQLGNSNTGANADGIAFLVQNSPAGAAGGLNALGTGGGGIGYAGIPNSLAIEFNTYYNQGSDPNSNDVTIQSCGTAANDVGPSCAIKTNDLTGTSISLADGSVHVATVTYSVQPGCTTAPCSTIDVVLDGVDLFPGGVPFDITTIGLTNSAAYVGFTGGTGADDDEQDVDSWTFSSSQTQSGTVAPNQSNPTTFDYSGGFAPGNTSGGYNFSAQQTTTSQTVQMTVTAIPMTQAACNAVVQQNPNFGGAHCFVYQNGGGQGQDAAVMFEVTCTANGVAQSCGSLANPFNADLGTQFSFSCGENAGLTCPPNTTDTSGGSFGLPHLTPNDGTPSVGFLKGEGPNPAHPCTAGATPLFTSNQIESFKLGDTSGGAKGGSGGTTSCWVMTYLTQSETPSITVTQPANNGTYRQNQSDATTTASYSCAAVSTGDPNTVAFGPYLSIPLPPSLYAGVCSASNSVGGAVASGAPFDTGTLGPHTFTVQVQDSAMNTSQTLVTYTVVAPPAISGPSSAVFAVGTPNSVQFNATGYPVPSFTEVGALPSGVTFVDNKNGTATLSGTATVSGIYKITVSATNGVSPAATLSFTLTSTATVPASGSKCNGVYSGTFQGSLTVTAGQSCTFINGGVTGNVSQTGGSFAVTGATVGGNFQSIGGTFAIGAGAIVKGNVSVLNLAKSSAQDTVCGARVGGNLQLVASFTPIAVGNGTVSCPGNTIVGNLSATANNAIISMDGNTVGGSLTATANLKPTQVFSNKIVSNLSCSSNLSITGGSNTASKKTGQCASF
ncbi:hypothetical protein DYQ86_15000 [Acidobacteria bacterium AB60]|nr:hypothetical protein DYQ86_15000 [Acidobacteria bacterium AB60]